jgi:nucleoside-diphosphate-sugar epimerase
MGADEGAASRYHLTKRAADRRLATLGVPWIVLRPSFVYGPGDRSMAFFERLAILPLAPLPGDGRFLVQPVHVDDLVRAVVLGVERDDLRDFAVDVGGAAPLAFGELLDALARRAGRAGGARKVRIPWAAMRAVAAITDAVGRGPITSEELGMLRRGNAASNEEFVKRFGFEPRGVEVGLAER